LESGFPSGETFGSPTFSHDKSVRGVVDAETCKKELVIEIPVDVVRQEAENVTAQYARLARIPGFRPGHAPAALVRRHFREGIRNEVVQSLLPKFFANAVKEQKWSVVGRPEFEELKFEDDQPMTCKATFEVYPEFALSQYKGLEVEEDLPTVTEGDVDQALEEVRQRAATFEVVENRPAEDDDYVMVNYRGQDIKTPQSRPLEAREAMVHLGGKGTVGAFTENLRGAKPGDVREFQVSYPDDYPQKSLVGKTFSYRLEVLSIKRKVLPPIADELAKSVSEFSTLAELRDNLRDDLTEQRRHGVEAEAKQKLVERLLDTHPIPVPRALVQTQLQRKLERVLSQLISQGIDPRAAEIDWGKLREESRPNAEREVRASLILQKIADAENLEVLEEELDEFLREMAREGHETAATLKTRLTSAGELERMRSTRRNQKALDFIYRNAKIIRKSQPAPAPIEG
jgi:trigger factor